MGKKKKDGSYPKNSLNFLIENKLKELNAIFREAGGKQKEEEGPLKEANRTYPLTLIYNPTPMTKGPYAPVPLVSIVVVNWNGIKVLDRCLTSLSAQTFQDFEIIVVDNGSGDGSVDLLGKKWPGIHLEKLPANRGFALANNHGARIAQGKWLALVNNDAFPAPEWLEELLAASEKNPEFSFFTSCLRWVSNRIGLTVWGMPPYQRAGLASRTRCAATLEPQEASESFWCLCRSRSLPKTIFREWADLMKTIFVIMKMWISPFACAWPAIAAFMSPGPGPNIWDPSASDRPAISPSIMDTAI